MMKHEKNNNQIDNWTFLDLDMVIKRACVFVSLVKYIGPLSVFVIERGVLNQI